jgi:hypothetical protein
MNGGLARYFTMSLRAGFWTTVLAAVVNGVYWRVGARAAVHQPLAMVTAGDGSAAGGLFCGHRRDQPARLMAAAMIPPFQAGTCGRSSGWRRRDPG